jgi:hypothetical protein
VFAAEAQQLLKHGNVQEQVMISRSLALGLLAAGCVTAAGGGAYVAVRQNAPEPARPAVTVAQQAEPGPQPVSETEAVVAPRSPAAVSAGETAANAEATRESTVERPTAPQREPTRQIRTTRRRETVEVAKPPRTPANASSVTTRPVETPPAERELTPATPAAPVEAVPEAPRVVETADPPEPRFEDVTVPASAVIGLQVESAVSSERAQLEDRVTARVTRDVMAGGRVAIPAGSRVFGSVTLVEKGGKIKERARLGVRFHTLVLADGTELALRTEQILREGEPPARDSSRKIGGAAVGGAILGAILGGGKGAVIGGATGAAGGTAVVMAGERHAATLPAGAIVTVRLTSPVDVQIEKH